MEQQKLTDYLDELLDIESYNDLCPNGLQVQGKLEITKILCGVSACVELFELAAVKKAQAVLVHHGVIWNFEKPVYKGGYKKRLKILFDKDINLLAYHLPLDAHETYGNNACIAKLLQLEHIKPFGDYHGTSIGFKGDFNGKNPDHLFSKVKEIINMDAVIFPFGPDKVKSVGVISGGAQKEIKQAVLHGLDAFITGEVSEHIYHYAKEEGIHFIAAGHHATEIFGVRALGNHIKKKFSLDVEFVNIHNPV